MKKSIVIIAILLLITRTAYAHMTVVGLGGRGIAYGPELIDAQVNREFATETHNWITTKDGAGTLTWDDTDIGGNTAHLKMTSSGDSYFYATLAATLISVVDTGVKYAISVDMYVPAANTNKTVLYGDASGTDWSPLYSTQILTGDTWTTLEHIATYNGPSDAISVGFSGDPADGDIIYFDNVSVRRYY